MLTVALWSLVDVTRLFVSKYDIPHTLQVWYTSVLTLVTQWWKNTPYTHKDLVLTVFMYYLYFLGAYLSLLFLSKVLYGLVYYVIIYPVQTLFFMVFRPPFCAAVLTEKVSTSPPVSTSSPVSVSPPVERKSTLVNIHFIQYSEKHIPRMIIEPVVLYTPSNDNPTVRDLYEQYPKYKNMVAARKTSFLNKDAILEHNESINLF
jgi:hypothetical protein